MQGLQFRARPIDTCDIGLDKLKQEFNISFGCYAIGALTSTYLKPIEERPLLRANDNLPPLRTPLGGHQDVPNNIIQSPEYALLPPHLRNYSVEVMPMVSKFQLL